MKREERFHKKLIGLVLIGVALALFSSCSKENEEDAPLLNPASIKILQDDFSDRTLDLTPGDGVMLATYTTQDEKVIFVLMTNEAEIIWRKDFGITAELYPGTGDGSDLRIDQILYEGNGVFSLLATESGLDSRFLKINTQGELILDETNFFTLTNGYYRYGMLLDKEQSYISFGSVGTGRAFLSKQSSSGEVIFREVFSESLSGSQAVTGCVETNAGDLVVAGTFLPDPFIDISPFVFLRKYSADGEVLWSNRYELEPLGASLNTVSLNEGYGKDLIENPDGTFSFFINQPDQNADQSRARLVKFSSEGDFIKEDLINLASTNLIGGTSKNLSNSQDQGTIGQSLTRKADGTYIGIVNRYNESGSQFGTNLRTPHFPYIFELSASGDLINMEFSDRVYSTFYTTCITLSNGKTAIYGRIISVGEDSKPLIIIQE